MIFKDLIIRILKEIVKGLQLNLKNYPLMKGAMYKLSLLFLFISAVLSAEKPPLEQEIPPQFLYKILSLEDWKNSQGKRSVTLSSMDHEFIHLAKEDQAAKIIEKYWPGVAEVVVLKVYTNKLPGRLMYEANPGGANKYYHLYGGSIPLEAVFKSNIVKNYSLEAKPPGL